MSEMIVSETCHAGHTVLSGPPKSDLVVIVFCWGRQSMPHGSRITETSPPRPAFLLTAYKPLDPLHCTSIAVAADLNLRVRDSCERYSRNRRLLYDHRTPYRI